MQVLFPLAEPVLPGKARFAAIVSSCAALARAGVQVDVLLPGKPEAFARYAAEDLGVALPPGLAVHQIAGWHAGLGHPVTWNFVAVSSALRAVRRLARGPRSVIHVRHESIAAALARRSGREPPFVFEAHAIGADYERERGRPARRVARAAARLEAILRGAGGLAAISRGLLDEIVRRHGFDGPTAVARSGIDLDRFPHAWPEAHARPQDRERRVVYVGRVGAWKGVGQLIEAMLFVMGSRLVLVGPGDRAEIEDLRARAGSGAGAAAGRVDFVGRVPNRDVAALLASADVAVHTLDGALSIAARDTSPLKLLEYLAVGVPVVAPDLPSIREIVEDGTSAVLVPPGDTRALGEAIARVLADNPLQERLSRAGLEVARRHTWDERARILMGLYERVLAKGAS